MIKFETVVYVALVTLISAPSIWAQTSPAPNPLAGMGQYNPEERCKNEQPLAKFLECLAKVRGAKNPSSETCREAEKNFEEKAGDFKGSCTGVGLPNDELQTDDSASDSPDERRGRVGGAIGCSWSLNRCRCLDKITEEEKDRYKCREQREGSRRSDPESLQSSLGLIDIGAAKRRLDLCPHEEPDDTDRYEKQLEKSQERLKELKKKMPELMTKNSEALDKAAEKDTELRKQGQEIQDNLRKRLREIKNKKEGEEQQAVAEMAQMREKMDQIDAQIRSLELSKVDAEVKLSEAKTQVELNCHTTATQQVAGLQTQKMAEIGRRQSQGNFNKLMKSVGVSSREAWEKRAKVFYRRCIDSRPTRDSKKAAQNIYESTIRQVETAISSARQNRFRLEENITQVMTTSGCGQSPNQANGMTGESKMCRAMRNAQEEMTETYEEARSNGNLLQQQGANAQRTLATKNQALSTEYAEAQRELMEEELRMQNLRNYMNAKRERRKGVGGKKAGEDLNTNFGKLTGAAGTYDGCCAQDDRAEAQASLDGTEFTRLTSKEKCKRAMDFMEHLGTPSSQRNQMRSPAPTRSRTPSPAPERETPRTPPPPAGLAPTET